MKRFINFYNRIFETDYNEFDVIIYLYQVQKNLMDVVQTRSRFYDPAEMYGAYSYLIEYISILREPDKRSFVANYRKRMLPNRLSGLEIVDVLMAVEIKYLFCFNRKYFPYRDMYIPYEVLVLDIEYIEKYFKNIPRLLSYSYGELIAINEMLDGVRINMFWPFHENIRTFYTTKNFDMFILYSNFALTIIGDKAIEIFKQETIESKDRWNYLDDKKVQLLPKNHLEMSLLEALMKGDYGHAVKIAKKIPLDNECDIIITKHSQIWRIKENYGKNYKDACIVFSVLVRAMDPKLINPALLTYLNKIEVDFICLKGIDIPCPASRRFVEKILEKRAEEG